MLPDGKSAMNMASFKFTKADRIQQRTEFLHLSKFGIKHQNRHFIAYALHNNKDHSRLGITVTKKVGHAVARNRIKRLIREHFRQNRYKLSNSWDIKVVAKIHVNIEANKTICLSLENLFERLNK